jgi:hypothetical protein
VSNTAVLHLDSPAGFVHVLIKCEEEPVEGVGLIWRAVNDKNFWCFEVGSWYAQVSIMEDGRWFRQPRVKARCLPPNTVSSLQVFDDGEAIRLYINGKLIYGTTLYDGRLQAGAGVGIRMAQPGSGVTLHSFEAHPREIHIPRVADLHGPALVPGETAIVADSFEGPPGDLANHVTTVGGLKWSRDIGHGVIELTGNGSARVMGSPRQPCPGRTGYMIDWPNHEFADIQVRITPAGKRKGMKEKGRAGLIFWQDPGNYLTLSAFVEDWPAMSIAAFFQIAGFEELFDAVWSNVGSRMHWGEPHDFRVIFDGKKFAAYVNDEPVLYRALSDVYPEYRQLLIRKVGIVANWEWGTDTGSIFENFLGLVP